MWYVHTLVCEYAVRSVPAEQKDENILLAYVKKETT